MYDWTTVKAIHNEKIAHAMKKASRTDKKFADSKWKLRFSFRK